MASSYNTIIGGIHVVYDYRHMQSAVFSYLGVAWDPFQLVGAEATVGQGFLWGFERGVTDYEGAEMSFGAGLSIDLPVLEIVGIESGLAGVLSLPVSEEGAIEYDKPRGIGWSGALEAGVGLPIPIEEAGGHFELARYEKMDDVHEYGSAREMSQAIQNSGNVLQAHAAQAICGIPAEWTQILLNLPRPKDDSDFTRWNFGWRGAAATLPYLYETAGQHLDW
jgi:hypothetical protein